MDENSLAKLGPTPWPFTSRALGVLDYFLLCIGCTGLLKNEIWVDPIVPIRYRQLFYYKKSLGFGR